MGNIKTLFKAGVPCSGNMLKGLQVKAVEPAPNN